METPPFASLIFGAHERNVWVQEMAMEYQDCIDTYNTLMGTAINHHDQADIYGRSVRDDIRVTIIPRNEDKSVMDSHIKVFIDALTCTPHNEQYRIDRSTKCPKVLTYMRSPDIELPDNPDIEELDMQHYPGERADERRISHYEMTGVLPYKFDFTGDIQTLQAAMMEIGQGYDPTPYIITNGDDDDWNDDGDDDDYDDEHEGV